MNDKSRKKLDILMTILMIVVMSYQATGNLFHEVAGVILLVLFVVHNILNRKWYKNILKGKYSGFRKMMLIINILTLIGMLTAMGTGIYLSQSVFASLLGMREAYLIRSWHVAAGAWGMILVSSHGGMHIRISRNQKPLYLIGGILLAAFGIWAFFALDMPNRLILRDTGMYWRYSGISLFLANASMMTFFAGLRWCFGSWDSKKGNIILMKRVISILMTITMIFSLVACGQTTTNETQTEHSEKNKETVEVPHEDGKTLIAYFSWSTSGNTEKMATYIQEQTDGDLLELEPVNPYPTDYEECGDVAKVERDENARPEIANLPDSIEEYDTIFVGYPKLG